MAFDTSFRHIPLPKGGSLHLTRLGPSQGATRLPVLCWHDIAASGAIFWKEHVRGTAQSEADIHSLAPWLALRGHEVAIIDQRGHGLATPKPSRGIRFDQSDVIVEEIPTALSAWLQDTGASRTHVIAHGWGGVLIAAHLARTRENRRKIASQVYLGTRRQANAANAVQKQMIVRRWIQYGSLIRGIYGYMPARQLRWGTDNEYAGNHRQHVRWLKDDKWQDERDGFDYGRALIRGGLPPTLHMAGNGDEAFGHSADVARFRDECGPHQGEFRLLGTPGGLSHDYGHDDLLNHERCQHEVYPLIEDWLQEYEY
ncbi:alpha/beta fold hydrolase [Phytohalomonas tamaricis]|uniref:alpha/beta fold hydrolase n=1 Tax=Phytohalomonas tamaricis TaxID=2081032 RepID=UPI00131A2B13|nr:alpha/beta fold hydrolase [Phytohalomonas tamaricis]